jgi:5-methylcytosine-specific restriction endonuclease McrA
MEETVVLNYDYNFLSVTSWKRAIILVLTEKAEILYSCPDRSIRTESNDFPYPLIIKLRNFVNMMKNKSEFSFSRDRVFCRDNYKCQYCGIDCRKFPTLDHVVPKSMNGGTCWENVVTACLDCNQKKGNRTPKQAGMTLRKTPKKPSYVELCIQRTRLNKRSRRTAKILNEYFSSFESGTFYESHSYN